jgi:hypothetical protein
MVLVETEKDYTLRDIVWFELVNITEFQHLDSCAKQDCKIPHTRTVADWLSHVFFLNSELFALCETVLIERQPPGGQIAVEQLLFFQYRSKAILIHPRSVHAFFRWTDEDYERRKLQSVKVFQRALEKSPRNWLIQEFYDLERQHDVSDAYIQLVYYVHVTQEEYNRQLRRKRCATSTDIAWFNRFRYQPLDDNGVEPVIR